MKKFKKFLAVALATAMISSVTACGGADNQQAVSSNSTVASATSTDTAQTATKTKKDVQLSLMHPFGKGFELYIDAVGKTADALGYKVSVDAVDSETYKTKIKVAMAGNELPDIFFTWGDSYTQPFLDSKLLLPITKAVKESGLKFNSSYVQPYTDNEIYTAPYAANDYFVGYYNKELFAKMGKQPPKDWNELIDVIKAAQKIGVAGLGLADGARWQGDLLYNMLVLRQDPMAFKNAYEGNGKFTDAPFLDAAKQVKELVDMGAFQKGFLMAQDQEVNEMMQGGKIAMYALGTWLWSGYMDKMGDKLGYFVFPKTGKDEKYMESANTMFGALANGFCVSAQTKFPDEAAKYVVKYSEIVNNDLLKKGTLGFIDTGVKPDKPLHPAYEQFTKDVANVKSTQAWWFGVVPAAQGEPMRDLSQKLFGGKVTPENFVKELETTMRKK